MGSGATRDSNRGHRFICAPCIITTVDTSFDGYALVSTIGALKKLKALAEADIQWYRQTDGQSSCALRKTVNKTLINIYLRRGTVTHVTCNEYNFNDSWKSNLQVTVSAVTLRYVM